MSVNTAFNWGTDINNFDSPQLTVDTDVLRGFMRFRGMGLMSAILKNPDLADTKLVRMVGTAFLFRHGDCDRLNGNYLGSNPFKRVASAQSKQSGKDSHRRCGSTLAGLGR